MAIYTARDRLLLGEGLMRDIARRVQALRRDLGFKPTDILAEVHVAGLTSEDLELLRPHVDMLRYLVRAREVEFHAARPEELGPELAGLKWRAYRVDGREIHIAIEHDS